MARLLESGDVRLLESGDARLLEMPVVVTPPSPEEVKDVRILDTTGAWVSIVGPAGEDGVAADIIDDTRIRNYLTWSSEKIDRDMAYKSELHPEIHDHSTHTNIGADDHHNQVHSLWGPDHNDVDYSTAMTNNQIIRYDGAQFIPDRRTKVHGGGTLPANNVSLPGDIWFNNGTGTPSTSESLV